MATNINVRSMKKRFLIAAAIGAALFAGAANAQTLPIVNTNSSTGITAGETTFNGYVDPQGTTDIVRGFEWGTTTGLGQQTSMDSQTGAGSFSFTIFNLSSQTTYYFRAIARNGAGTVRGSIFTFTTTGSSFGVSNAVPIVSTNAPSSVTQISATLNGYVDTRGTWDTVRWFEWGTSTSFGNITNQISQGQNSSDFTVAISGLASNTTYYFRAVARNGQDTVYGSIMSFNTNRPTQAPVAITRAATVVMQSGALLNGQGIADTDVSSDVWFEWGKTNALGNATKALSAGFASPIDYSNSMIGLSPNTTYYFRAVIRNARGIAYGGTLSFHTLAGSGSTSSTSSGSSSTTLTPVPATTAKPTGSLSIMQSVSNQTAANGSTGTGGPEATASAGETIQYTAHLQNTSNADVMNVVVNEPINPYVDFVSASDNGAYDATAHVVTWKLSLLNSHDTKDFIVYVSAKSFPQQTIAETIATVQADKLAQQPSNIAKLTINPQAVSTNFGGPRGRLPTTLSITAPKDLVKTDEKINFTVKYRNEGSDSLNNAVLTLTLPSELSYSQVVTGNANVDKRVLDNGQTIELSLGNLLSGDDGEVILSASLRKDVADQKIFTTIAALKYQYLSGAPGEESAFVINTADASGGFAALLGSNLGLGMAMGVLALIIILLVLLLIRSFRRRSAFVVESRSDAIR